jgi:putative membrane protein
MSADEGSDPTLVAGPDSKPTGPPSVRDHLANERTLLAWIRTAITIIGLGFIVDRLAADSQRSGIAAFAGVVLVLIGGLVALAGAYSFLAARREMLNATYRPRLAINLALVALVVVGAVAVAAFLITAR